MHESLLKNINDTIARLAHKQNLYTIKTKAETALKMYPLKISTIKKLYVDDDH